MFKNITSTISVVISIAIMSFIWKQSDNISKLNTSVDNHMSTILKLEDHIDSLAIEVNMMSSRYDIQYELTQQSILATKEMEHAYDIFRNELLDSNGRMLIKLDEQFTEVATAATNASTTTGRYGPGSYVYLPPKMARDILGILKDGDKLRNDVIGWQRWYCKHNPTHSECEDNND